MDDTNVNMGELLDRIKEMRGFFQFGGEVIPFLTDLFEFLREIMPLMNQVNISLEDSQHKLPTAKDRIADVTEATEMATHEILDKLEIISTRLGDLESKDNKEVVEEIQGHILDINFALQFQDITSQKLEHANKILSAINEKFQHLYSVLEQTRGKSSVSQHLLSVIDQEVDKEKQESDRAAFEKETEDIVRHEQISQDDIDDLFS